MKRAVPWAMVWLRVLLCPVVYLGAHRGWDGKWLGLLVLVALVDDIYDGILARRWGTDTEALRRADSWADTIFYLGVAGALWVRDTQLLRGNWRPLATLAAFEVTRHVFDWWKFRRAAAYHSHLAKAWGLVMGTAVIGVLSFGGPRWLVWVSVLVGIAADCEGPRHQPHPAALAQRCKGPSRRVQAACGHAPALTRAGRLEGYGLHVKQRQLPVRRADSRRFSEVFRSPAAPPPCTRPRSSRPTIPPCCLPTRA